MSEALSPSDPASVPPAAREAVRDAFAGSLHRAFWVAVVVALVGLVATRLMPRGKATDIRDQVREESKVDSLVTDGETFEITTAPLVAPAAPGRSGHGSGGAGYLRR